MAQLDRSLGVDRYLAGGALRDYLASGLGYPPCVADPIQGAGVRFNAYMKTRGANAQLVLHAVNYNLPLVGEVPDGGVIPVENLPVQVRVPQGWEIQAVQALEPGVSAQTLPFNVQDGVLEIVLPTIIFYKLIAISAAVTA